MSIAKLIVLPIVLVLIFSSVGVIMAGERGVLMTFGAVHNTVLEEGLYFKIPFAQTVERVDVKIQKKQVEAGASSKDLQIVTSQIALNYHLIPDSVNKLWQEVGFDYEERIIAPSIQEVVKAEMANFVAEELITKREVVKESIKSNLKSRLAENYIAVDELNIVNFEFSKVFNEAIEAKVTADQLKLKADRDLERIKVEADQEIAEAKGKAEAIRVESAALKSNPDLIKLRWIEKWNGQVPEYWGEASPFIGIGS